MKSFTLLERRIPPMLGWLLFGLLLSLPFLTAAQTNTAEWNGSGYSLKKVVSNTTMPSGVSFSYTILFTAPAGASSVNITDAVPSTLNIVSVPTPALVCGVTPAVSVSGNNVSYSLSGLPSSCSASGSFTIVVQFPAGTTCPGTVARNQACILVNGKPECTPFVSTTATAADPWVISKSIVDGAVVNPSGGSCGYLLPPNGTVTYRLCVQKANPYWGNVSGQINMSSAAVTDVLPAGAVFVSSTCGATISGNTITWIPNSGNLNAANPWAIYCCDIQVQYPSGTFPNGTQIPNTATLTGTICNQPATHTSNQTCVQIGQVTPNPNAFFQKYINLTNRVPGCQGYYTIVFCNNGNVPLSAFNINDAIPSGITVNKVQIYGASGTAPVNLTANSGSTTIATGISGGFYDSGLLSPGISSLQMSMTGTLNVGACLQMVIYFTVGANPAGTIITNCASFQPLSNALTLPNTCVPFTVAAAAPQACVLKDICTPLSSYEPGDTVRFRLRVQNIGSADLSGASIQDILHSNFTYLGNETHYIATTYSPPCSVNGNIPSGTTAWTGLTSSHSGNTLNWSLPDIPADCQLFYVAYCSYYGTSTLPYYFIEFDAVISNTAMPGVTPNLYSISGGNLPSGVNSNTVNIVVVASFGQEATKEVSTDAGATYASSGNTLPGGTARYRLKYKNTSNVPVGSIILADLLGRNDGTNDWLVLNRTANRGSQFDITHAGGNATSLQPTSPAPSPTLDYSPGNNLCLTQFGINSGCGAAAWASGTQKNARMQYGSYLLLPGITLREDFNVNIPATATVGQQVCNDFAGISTAQFLLNGNPTSVALTPIAAPPVCLTVDKKPATCCDSTFVTKVQGACCAKITTTCEVRSIQVIVTNGALANVTWNCSSPVPSNYVDSTNYTFYPGLCALDMNVCLKNTNGVGILQFIITFANGEKCEKIFDIDCGSTPPPCCEETVVKKIQGECCARLTTKCEVKSIDVTVTNGTLSNVMWTCAASIPSGYIGQSSYTFAPGNCVVDMKTCITPSGSGAVSITFVINFANGEKCEKTIQMDCGGTSGNCCEKTTVTPVQGKCCAQLRTDCEVKSVQVNVLNGTLASVNWNCATPVPSGYVGQSSYTFAPGACALDMQTCINATTTGSVTINYVITFANGEKCEKSIKIDCEALPPADCCPIVDFKLKAKFPFFKTHTGTWTILNPPGSSPICGVTISASPAASFTLGNLFIDGGLSSQSWNSTTIPVSGNLSPAAVNSLQFSLTATNYSGVIEICVLKCDGTKCCYRFNWNKKPIDITDVSHEEVNFNGKLFATTVRPVIKSGEAVEVKYIAFGMRDENEIKEFNPEFFAISGAEHPGDELPEGLAPVKLALMGKHNAFFELREPVQVGTQSIGNFNLVFKNALPKLGVLFFDADGNIVYQGEANLTGTGVSTSVVQINKGEQSFELFELLELYPNPNEGNFQLSYALGNPREVQVSLMNNLGQEVQVLQDGKQPAGVHRIQVEGQSLPAGTYHLVIRSEGKTIRRQVVVQ